MTRLISKRLLAIFTFISLYIPYRSQGMEPSTPPPVINRFCDDPFNYLNRETFYVERYSGPIPSLNPAKLILGLQRRRGNLVNTLPKDVARHIAKKLKPKWVWYVPPSCPTEEQFSKNFKALEKCELNIQGLQMSSCEKVYMGSIILICRSFPYLVQLTLVGFQLRKDQPGLAELAESLPNLRDFNCCSWTYDSDALNTLEDISPLSRFNKLERLYLMRNHSISDFMPLHTLTNLTSLNLELTRIIDLHPLRDLTKLQYLKLDQTQVVDPSPLENHVNLRDLSFTNCRIRSVQSLTKLTNLETLGLGRTQVDDLSPLIPITNLRKLFVYYGDNFGGTFKTLKETNPGLKVVLRW